MIEKLLGELYWDQLPDRINEFMKCEKFSTYKMMFADQNLDHKFLTSCNLFSSYINWCQHGKSDLWSKSHLEEWGPGSIAREYFAQDLVDELQDNLTWIKSYLIDRTLVSHSTRTTRGCEVTLSPHAPEEKAKLFHFLVKTDDLEIIWNVFEREGK